MRYGFCNADELKRLCTEDGFFPVLRESFSLSDRYLIVPGLVDVHVHLREPGFSYKATIATETRAAARGGVTAICAMPNLNPTPDTPEHLKVQQDLIDRDAVVRVYPYGTITMGEMGQELSDLEGLKEHVIAFSDDGKGVQNEDMMRAAMHKVAPMKKIIAAHCEENSLLRGGYIHDGEYAKAHGHRGICSESEWAPIARDVKLSKETGCAYHVCHVSAKESIEVIRRAKAEGADVTCETGPHYLLLDDSCLQEDARFKMNPPLRDKSDRKALIEGILDCTIDMIVTDHAPHSAEEKNRGLEKSAMGVVGLETSFLLMYTGLVKTGVLTLKDLVRLMHDAPCERFGIDTEEDYAVFDVGVQTVIDPKEFVSMGKSTPFAGQTVDGRCMMTVCRGKTVYCDETLKEVLA